MSRWSPYVPVAKRRAQAQSKIKSLTKKGQICDPVVIEGRIIARTFWGKKWCENLESYSDYDNRLARGRTYVRNGSVIDLQITPSQITAIVAGSDIYKVKIDIQPLTETLWNTLQQQCTGQVSSLIELLQGKLSHAVMEVVAQPKQGLFPTPQQMTFHCNCLDSASMCKHVAAVLYGIGARLDSQPEILFLLREVDPQQLIQQTSSLSLGESTKEETTLVDTDLAALFDIELFDIGPEQSNLALNTSLSSAEYTVADAANEQKVLELHFTARELLHLGIPRHTQQNWLRTGVLLHSGKRGQYRVGEDANAKIHAYLAERQKT